MDECLDGVKRGNELRKSSNELRAAALKELDSINAQMNVNNAKIEACIVLD
jgi:hypothetical protein